MWYIWKNRNENLQKILHKAEIEGTLWTEAQLLVQKNHKNLPTVANSQLLEDTRVCFVDRAWREQDSFMG